MKRYFYKLHGLWLTGFARSRKHLLEMIGIPPEELLTEKQAIQRAERDRELADFIQSAYLCDLMCP